MSVQTQADHGFTPEFQVYEPHKTGIPPLKPYVKELWRRRQFASELSSSTLRAGNAQTMFGRLWLVLNPLLLAMVYYLLVNILSKNKGGISYLDHLVAGVFGFYYVSGTLSSGAVSVVGSGALIANMSFPRLLMPLSALRSGFFKFLPTLPVFFVIHAIASATQSSTQAKLYPVNWSFVQLGGIYFVLCMTLFGAGIGTIFAALQVYFRDMSSFLPYMNRIWLYLSPVLWTIQTVPGRLERFMVFNPLFSILGGWTDMLTEGRVPPLGIWVRAAAWSVGIFVAGSLFFMSREREFAVRL